MRSLLAAFFLLAALAVPLTLESAPVPKVPVQAFIQFVKPPKGMAMDKYREQQIIHLQAKSVHDVVDCARSQGNLHVNLDDGKKTFDLSIMKKQKDPQAWLNENLQIVPVGTRSIRIRFAAGSKSEQAAIINAIVWLYDAWGPPGQRGRLLWSMKNARESISRKQPFLKRPEAELAQQKREVPKDKVAAAELARRRATTKSYLDYVKSWIKEDEDRLRKCQAELEDEPPEPVIRWAKE